MKNIKINNFTYLFLIIAFLCGYIKCAIIIFVIVIIHEFGHVFFIKIFNEKIINITIYPFGGITNINKFLNYPLNKELLIASGGILFQIVLFFLISIIPLGSYSKHLFYKYNKAILFFNLLPIIPLDGSIIFNCIVNKYVSFKYSYIIKIIVSISFISLFIMYNIKYSLTNYILIVFLIYKTYYYYRNRKSIFNKFLLERYLYDIKYNKIKYNTNNVSDLMIDVRHYFKNQQRIVNEREIIKEIFDKKTYF